MNKQASKARILVADDDESFCLATRSFFRNAGFEVDTAPDAARATELLRTQSYDLLIADLNMPGNAGLELVQTLPHIAAGLPVILLTGAPSVQTAAQSVRLQVVAYLVKPPNPDELLAAAEQAIANHQVYRTIRSNRERLETWLRDLRGIEEHLSRSPRSADAGVADGYLNLTLGNLLAGLIELKSFTDALTQRPDQQPAVQQVALYKALQDTIAVLERTKQSFKSKELGELRRRLEGLIEAQPPADSQP